MKLSTIFVSAAGVASVSAGWMPSQITVNEDLAVPGENPLFFCEDPADNILNLKEVDLSPNPPEGGKTLTIAASGTLKEKVEEGAKMKVQVKYGLITLINQEMDLCDTVKKADLECPIEKGDMKLTKDVDLPKEIPPGQYTVLADVYTKDNDKITCLTAKVAFHR